MKNTLQILKKQKVFMRNKNKIGSNGNWVVRNNSGRKVIIAR